MPTAGPRVNPHPREVERSIRPLDTLSMEELVARRCELAEQIDPLWQRLDSIDDELMHRQRAQRRARILAGPADAVGHEACDTEASALAEAGGAG